MSPADDARLTRIEDKIEKQGMVLARLDTFVREDAKRSRRRLDELEETVNCPDTGLVVRVDRLRQRTRLMWGAAVAAISAGFSALLAFILGR